MVILILILNLAACQTTLQQEMNAPFLTESKEVSIITETKTDQNTATELYNEFLSGNTKAGGWNINDMTIPTGEPDRRYATSYAYFDSNGDKIPELHINASRYYYIFTIRNDKIVEWKNLSPYPHYYALNNGAFISRKFGAGSMHDKYNYFILDYSGDEIYSLSFSKYDKNQNGIYDDADDYLFDGVNVTKEQWGELTERFLYIDETNAEHIRNEIEWTVLFKGTN